MKLLSNKEAAEYLRVSASFLNQARVYGTGPQYSKIGKLVVYRIEDLDAFVADRLVRSTSAAEAANG